MKIFRIMELFTFGPKLCPKKPKKRIKGQVISSIFQRASSNFIDGKRVCQGRGLNLSHTKHKLLLTSSFKRIRFSESAFFLGAISSFCTFGKISQCGKFDDFTATEF